MPGTFPCTFDKCDKVFTKAYELKKHMVAHTSPEKIFHCSQCEFITLTKSSLMVHTASHTGEKVHHCPDMSLDAPGVQCDYKTHDSAALSKHRKRLHDYVPPANRSRPKGGNAHAQPKDDKTARRPTRTRRTVRRKLSRMFSMGNAVPGQPTANAEDDVMDVDEYYYESDDDMDLEDMYDPTLSTSWLAKYEHGYSSFDATGLKYRPGPARAGSTMARPDVASAREGCLCPDWMVEAGVWEAPRREYIVLDA